MAREYLQIPPESEKSSSPFSFLLMIKSHEVGPDITVLYSFKGNNVARDELSVTDIPSNKQLIQKKVGAVSKKFLERFPDENDPRRKSAIKFAEDVEKRVKDFLEDSQHKLELDI